MFKKMINCAVGYKALQQDHVYIRKKKCTIFTYRTL